tara:strand:- start:107 stop:511 length:405 start_codon:yes stop_codon:yes gene_type:complete
MIDLSNAKVDEEYILSNGYVATTLLVTGDAVVLGFVGVTIMANMSGETLHANGGLSVSAKVDQRPWLKDMPDAGIFTDDAVELLITSHGNWNVNLIDGGKYQTHGIKMPTLTSDQWKDSKISIVELAQWQKDNK